MILYCTLGAILLAIVLTILILQFVKKNSITITIDVNDKEDEADTD